MQMYKCVVKYIVAAIFWQGKVSPNLALQFDPTHQPTYCAQSCLISDFFTDFWQYFTDVCRL